MTDSTNTRAAELASDPANAGTVVTADLQSQGRGQHGRTWHSPPATNVLLSALLFPPLALRRPAVLTAFASVAVAETILQVTGKQSRIKWPNDVLLGGKKVCGILIEGGVRPTTESEAPSYPPPGSAGGGQGGGRTLAGSGGGVPGLEASAPHPALPPQSRGEGKTSASLSHFIVGIGLNVNQAAEDFRRMDLPDATSLSMAVGNPLDVRGITELLIQNLDDNYGRLLNGEIAALEECWAWRLAKLGQLVTVELTDANEVRGWLRRVTFDLLEVELPNGEVRLLRPEEVRHLR